MLRVPAPKKKGDRYPQDLYVSKTLKGTGKVLVKDEDMCVHCGLCAERCPADAGAWDMQKSFYVEPQASAASQTQPSRPISDERVRACHSVGQAKRDPTHTWSCKCRITRYDLYVSQSTQ